MSKFTEVQNQYQGYLAAIEAAEKAKPVSMAETYESGSFVYDPDVDRITIYYQKNQLTFNAEDMPALIKALRDFFD
jgi:hypothetical protein